MNDFSLWAQGSKFFKMLKVMVNMNNSKIWVEVSRWYEQLRVVDDLNDFES